jgi:hypothetical protein
MFDTIINEVMVNNSNHSQQSELYQFDLELQKLRIERNKLNLEFDQKIKELENERNEVQINLFPIKIRDKITTKEMYKIFKINKEGKTDRSINYEMVDKDYIKGKVHYIFNNNWGDCEIGVSFDLDEGLVSELELGSWNDDRRSNTIVSLDRFNDLYKTIK